MFEVILLLIQCERLQKFSNLNVKFENLYFHSIVVLIFHGITFILTLKSQ